MDGDLAELFAVVRRRPCRELACVWRPHSLCFVHHARPDKPPLAVPHLLPILPPLIHMKVLLTGATGAGQSITITVLAALEQLTHVFMTQLVWESSARFSSTMVLATSLTSAVAPSLHGPSSPVVPQPIMPPLRTPSFPQSSITTS
jgi:hypothetical protein